MANVGKVWNGTAWVDLGSTATFQSAGTATVGVVQLTDSTSSTSITTAATPNSVKSAYDLAGTAIPKNTVTAAGDILYASGSATVTRLGIGTANQVLSVSGTVPAWTTPSSGGGLTIIGTATPSAATTISFTSIPNTYKHLMLIWTGIFQSVTGEQFFVRLNNDNAAVYDYNGITATGATISDGTSADATGFGQLNGSTTAPIALTATSAADLTKTSNGMMIIYRYTDTGNRHVEWSQTSFRTAATSGYIWNNMRGVYAPTAGSAIDRIDFIRAATQTVTGTVYLYGVS